MHKAVVCTQSTYFAAAELEAYSPPNSLKTPAPLGVPWLGVSPVASRPVRGASAPTITLRNQDPALIKQLFAYLYTGDYAYEPADWKETSSKPAPNPHSSATAPTIRTRTPDVSILAGLAVNQDGFVVDAKGTAVGELIEGDAYRISRFNYTCDASGQVINVSGRLIGRAKPLPVPIPAATNGHAAKGHAANGHAANGHAVTPAVATAAVHKKSLAPSRFALHRSLHDLAHHFGVPGLAVFARAKFAAECKLAWDSEAFPSFLDTVLSTVTEKDKEDPYFQQVAVRTVADHLELLRKPQIEAIVRKFEGLALEILKMQVRGG